MNARDVLLDQGLTDPESRLAEWVERQRWYGGRGQGSPTVAVLDAAPLDEGGPVVLFVLISVTTADGTVRYHVPLGVRPSAEVQQMPAVLDRTVGQGERDGTAVHVYDALVDPACGALLWTLIAGERVVPTLVGELCCRNMGLGPDTGGATAISLLTREQSNTSLLRGEQEMLKCLRRVEEGVSPELEMTGALAASGFTGVAAPLGLMEHRARDGTRTLLALVQPFLRNGTEGWALALTSLRDLYASAEETGRRDEEALHRAVAEQGASFVHEAERLGDATAAMHLALSGEGLPEEMRPHHADAATLGRWAGDMSAELDRLLGTDSPDLAPLRSRRPTLLGRYDAMRNLESGGLAIRVHGDLHLGQVLRIDSGWVILDFEGEPARPLAERRGRSSPLRDVAGMMRSFDYAAAAALAERHRPGEPRFDELLPQGEAWARANRRSFWAAYTARAADSPLLPGDDGTHVMELAYETQKAVYEVGYELGHRPDWLGIPMRFLLRDSP